MRIRPRLPATLRQGRPSMTARSPTLSPQSSSRVSPWQSMTARMARSRRPLIVPWGGASRRRRACSPVSTGAACPPSSSAGRSMPRTGLAATAPLGEQFVEQRGERRELAAHGRRPQPARKQRLAPGFHPLRRRVPQPLRLRKARMVHELPDIAQIAPAVVTALDAGEPRLPRRHGRKAVRGRFPGHGVRSGPVLCLKAITMLSQ